MIVHDHKSAPFARIGRVRLISIATTIVLVLYAVVTGACTAARADTQAGLSVSVTPDHGGMLSSGTNLDVAITVTNRSTETIPAGTATLWFDVTPQYSRSDLLQWLEGKRSDAHQSTLGTVATPALAPNVSEVVRITVPANSVPFATRTHSTVFGIGVSVQAGKQTATSRGCLTWVSSSEQTHSNVSVIMPIVSPATGSGLLSAADLATETAPDGVLTRDLDGVSLESTVTLGIDPMIIASIRVLGNAAPTSAQAWLKRLQSLPNETFALAYGDADIAGQIQAGARSPLTPTSLAYAIDPENLSSSEIIGEPTATSKPTTAADSTPTPTPTSGVTLPSLEQLLAWNYSVHNVGWAADNSLEESNLAPLAAAGLTTVIASSDNTTISQETFIDNPIATSGKSTLVVSDNELSVDVQAAASASDDFVWNDAMSKVNAQLALLSADAAPDHHILISLGRSFPSSGTQLQRTLGAVLDSPWSVAETFSHLLTTPPTNIALKDLRESTERIDSIRDLLQSEGQLADFATILSDPASVTGAARARILTLLAVSWNNPGEHWYAALASNAWLTNKILQSVRILPTDNINLVSAQGSIPFTVSNGMTNQSVTVLVKASPSNSRLEVDAGTPKLIPADSRATMFVPVKARVGNGQVNLNIQLYSTAGVRIGSPTEATVHVHADWEGIGALILLIMVLALFAFGLLRGILRRRAQLGATTSDGDRG